MGTWPPHDVCGSGSLTTQNNCIVIHTIKIRIMTGAGINYKKWSLVCASLSLSFS